jgi:hypothetical protein
MKLKSPRSGPEAHTPPGYGKAVILLRSALTTLTLVPKAFASAGENRVNLAARMCEKRTGLCGAMPVSGCRVTERTPSRCRCFVSHGPPLLPVARIVGGGARPGRRGRGTYYHRRRLSDARRSTATNTLLVASVNASAGSSPRSSPRRRSRASGGLDSPADGSVPRLGP